MLKSFFKIQRQSRLYKQITLSKRKFSTETEDKNIKKDEFSKGYVDKLKENLTDFQKEFGF